MPQILQVRLKEFVNQELTDVQTGLKKAEELEIKLYHIHWNMEKAREFQNYIHFCFTDYVKAFECVDHNKRCGKFLKRWEYQTTLLASWETCVRIKK